MSNIIGYQVCVTQKSFDNYATLAEAREAFFALVEKPGNESAAIYSRLSEGGIGRIVAETRVHYEQGPLLLKKIPLVVLSTEREMERRRLRKAA